MSYFTDVFISLLIFLFSILLLFKKNRIFLISISSYIFLLTVIESNYAGKISREITIFTHAIRYFVPFALFINISPNIYSKHFREKIFYFLLTLGISLTFIFHGYKAMIANPEYVDFIIIVFQKYIQLIISESKVEKILILIGIIDIILGLVVFSKLKKFVLIYMAFWGLITAFLRIVFYTNFYGISEFLIRSFHWIIPIFLLNLTIEKGKK